MSRTASWLRNTSLALVLVASAGCAALIPMGPVLEGMGEPEVDTVVDKVLARYPNVGRMVMSEAFVLSLDSVIVGAPLEGGGEKELVSSLVGYMLGEEIGSQWVSRVQHEEVVLGEGHVELVVQRSASGDSYCMDILGNMSLFLPLPGGSRDDGVEVLSYDLRSSNQPLDIAGATGTAQVYLELLPRRAIYSSKVPMFERWTTAAMHLSWPRSQGRPETPLEERRAQAIEALLKHSRAFVGPVVRLELAFEETSTGRSLIEALRPNKVELVVPQQLISRRRDLEQALRRIDASNPGLIRREGKELLVDVGQFFFHADSTGPVAPDEAALRRNRSVKEFRIPRPQR